MRWFPVKLIVWFEEVVIDLYVVIAACSLIKKPVTLVYVVLPLDVPEKDKLNTKVSRNFSEEHIKNWKLSLHFQLRS